MAHAAPRPTPSPKNLVVRCDGTGNEISQNISTVPKLYRCLRKTDSTQPRQMVLCDPGGQPGDRTRKHPPRALTVH